MHSTKDIATLTEDQIRYIQDYGEVNMNESIIDMLIRHEGLKLKPYKDQYGNCTIGVGHLLRNGITEQCALLLLRSDLMEVLADLERIFQEQYVEINNRRRKALVSMRFNLGPYGFRSFKRMIEAVQNNDWDKAADEALDSLWAKQVPERANEIAEMLRYGK